MGSFAVALLPDEPAGRISTLSAGAAVFEAVLSPRPGEVIGADSLPCGDPPPGTRFVSRTVETDPGSSTWRLRCEVRAQNRHGLASALEGLLRDAAARAALADAVFEARVVRLAEPVAHPASLVQTLARDLWDAGFAVSFGPSWAPAADAGAAVGVGGHEKEICAFLDGHPGWRTVLPTADLVGA